MKIKVIFSFSLVLLLLVTYFPFRITALNADGILDEPEWETAEQTLLISSSGEANCGVSYGVVYIFCDESSNIVYIGFKAKVAEAIAQKQTYGVAFSVNSDDFISVTPIGVSDYNSDKYFVDAKTHKYSEKVYGAEVSLGVKYGLSSLSSLKVRFIDVDGIASNVYSVNIYRGVGDGVELEYTTQRTQNTDDLFENDTLITTAPKTTKIKTTKAKTTKEKSTKYETAKGENSVSDIDVSNTVSRQSDFISSDTHSEETTVITLKEMKLQKTFTYAAVCALIVLALGVCVCVNLARDKESGKKTDKK